MVFSLYEGKFLKLACFSLGWPARLKLLAQVDASTPNNIDSRNVRQLKMYRFSLLLTTKTALFSLNNLFFIVTVSHRRRRDISTKLRTAWNVTTILQYQMYLLVSVKLSVRATGFDYAQSSSITSNFCLDISLGLLDVCYLRFSWF